MCLASIGLLHLPCASAEMKETIIDNGDAEFSQVGFEVVTDKESRGGTFVLNAADGKQENYARFKPGLTGRYDVYLYWRSFPDKSTDVNWRVAHANGQTTQPFVQLNNPGWHFHGSYLLNAQSYVELSALTGKHGGPRYSAPVVADAVKFVPTGPRVVERTAKDTITPVTLNYQDELRFKRHDGAVISITLLGTGAEVTGPGAVYRFWAEFRVNDQVVRIVRILPTQESFYQPLEVMGLRIWLDAVSDIFKDDGGFLVEKDTLVGIACRPPRKARLAITDAKDRICPDRLVWWYPEKKDHIDVRECFNGQDVWMGPYMETSTHGGLDINMKSGTPLFAPIRFDDQYLYNSLKSKDNNNRWRGIRKWSNGSVWWLQAHHLNKMLAPENQPLEQGVKYAETAGVLTGGHEHTHFVFRLFEEGESFFLDPWILFWQTFKDNQGNPNGAAPAAAPPGK